MEESLRKIPTNELIKELAKRVESAEERRMKAYMDLTEVEKLELTEKIRTWFD